MQTHSCLRLLHKHPSGRPDVGQRKQRDQLRRVLLHSPITHLNVAKLALDHPERMLHLGTDTGPEFLGLLNEMAPRRVLLLPALAGAQGYVPIHARCFCSLSDLEQSFFGCKVRQPESLQQAMDAQHHLQFKRRAPGPGHRCTHRHQRHRLSPWHYLPHFIGQHLLVGAPRAQVQTKALVVSCLYCLANLPPNPSGLVQSFEHDP